MAALGGLALGAVTNILQGVLPDSLQMFANSGAVWVVAAYVAGLLVRCGPDWRTFAAGAATQVGAVVGYYGYAQFARDGMGALHAPAVWLAFALVAGPLFGTAGAWWRAAAQWRRVASLGVIGGVFAMEGFWHLLLLHYIADGVVLLAIAALLPLLLGRTARDRLLGQLAVWPLALAAAGALYGVMTATGLN
ncbi:DUF6518 family protein [Streptacidiphilus sp. N1-12]|uniref:DUF6518 family protein n=2 Tax=Streptacidiphilus alkalitolerans TaxID=3342712 RepID=A0ABV6X253_9ACTN